jgi:tetratricopeptide (TPR) repeat protein
MKNMIGLPLLFAFMIFNSPLYAQTSTEYNNQGLVKLNAKNYAASLPDFNKAVELDPKNEKAFHNRGLAKYALKDYEGSLKDYTRAIELNAAYSIAYNNRGMLYYRQENYTAALQDYNKAIENNPTYYQAYKNRASVQYAIKNYDAADKDYTKCIELKPDDAGGYLGRGSIQNNQKNYAAAIKFYDKALEYEPGLVVAVINRGNAKYALKDVKGALADYLKVIELQPNNANVYFNLGIIYMGQNKSNEAISAFKKYNAYLPGEWSGYKNTADVFYLQLALYDSAEYYYNKAYQINKREKEIIERLGYSLLNQKKIPEAIAMFKNQISLLPNDPWGFYNLGAACSVGKQYAEAIKNLDIALDKRMVELPYWETDKNLDNVRLLDEFKNVLKKYFNKDILAKYPKLFGGF